MFIPPEGAMQFEMMIGPEGDSLAEPIALWVWGSPIRLTRLRKGCACANGWTVIDFCDQDHPMRPKSAVADGLYLFGEDHRMTPRQLEILQHCLGVDKYCQAPKGFTPYTRNHFCAGASDEPDCRELVALGYMVQHETTTWLPYFNCSVTEEGKIAMQLESPAPPKLTRSQRRYRAFLNCDNGFTFLEWLQQYGNEVR